MIVVDASAAVAALVSGGSARQVLSRVDVHVPHLIDAEFLQVIRGLALRGSLDRELAEAMISAWSELTLERHGTAHLAPRIWELRDHLSAYEAAYVALAETLDSDLATADSRITRAPGVRCQVLLVAR